MNALRRLNRWFDQVQEPKRGLLFLALIGPGAIALMLPPPWLLPPLGLMSWCVLGMLRVAPMAWPAPIREVQKGQARS